MRISMSKRSARLLGTVAAAAGLVVSIGAGTASAGPSGITFNVGSMQSDGSRSVLISRGNVVLGSAYWTANGDTLKAVDVEADGYGIGAYLGTSPVREAGTFGKNSPIQVNVGGDLPEDKTYTFWACIGNNSVGLTCSGVYNVTS